MVELLEKAKKTQVRGKKDKKFPTIPHWNDPEIGYKALFKNIKIYVSYKHDEFVRLAPVISKDEFIWDTFTNIVKRDGYPQYNTAKNRGNFYSFVQTCCIRNQADWARKRNTRIRQLAHLQGVDIDMTDKNNLPEYKPVLCLDELIEDSDDCELHEKIKGSDFYDYTDYLALHEILDRISTDTISEKFNLTWQEFAGLLMTGWSVVDIAKKMQIHPTTTRKYLGILKEKLLEDDTIVSLLKDTGIYIK